MTVTPPVPSPADSFVPIDRAARERLRNDLDRTFFVEAGAGTGKTTTLVGRIENLIARGRVTIDRLAAITFTEAAASELRDRVREALERGSEKRKDPEEQARCRQAAGEIDLAAISTIHAFAGGLLRAFPLEAGLPPSLRTLDAIEQGMRFEERFRDWFRRAALQAPAADVLRRAFILGLTEEHLYTLAQQLEGQYDLLETTVAWEAPSIEPALPVAHRAAAELISLVDLLDYAKDGETDPLVKTIRAVQPRARRLAATTTEHGALTALVALGRVKLVGNQTRWLKGPDGVNGCKAIKDALTSLNGTVAALLNGARAATFVEVLGLLRDVVLRGVAERKRDGVATFQDLLVWARDLLRDDEAVRRRAQDRYRRLFVDEFQDTDPLQAEIAFYLAADPSVPIPADWRDITLEDGRLFIVGDPKQSIYRFRRADIAIYDALLRRLDHCREHLVQNFRSVRPVIDWVNLHFVGDMREEASVQPQYVELAASRESLAPDRLPGVYRFGGPRDGSAADVALAEASELAALASSMVREGWPVQDRGPGGERITRPARYRDVCILIRARRRLRWIEPALNRADVPYRLESGELILSSQEVRDLLNGLRALDDPSDEVALVATLRSPAFGCSDPDIVRWVEEGGELSHEAPGGGPDGPVKDALTWLARFAERRHTLSPPALIEAYIQERQLELIALDDRRPRESWRRLRYVVDSARTFTGTGRHTLRAFLDWIAGLASAEVRDVESEDAEQDEDAVRIMTVHQAKGLEFPIVILPGLGSPVGGGGRGVQVIADRERGSLECRVNDAWQTAGFDAVKARERAMEEAEAVRLLYVAGTRARDHLALSLFRGAEAVMSAAGRIERRLGGADELCLPLTPDEVPATDKGGAPADEAADPAWMGPECERAWLARRAEAVGRLTEPPRFDAEPAAAIDPWSLGEDLTVELLDGPTVELHREVRRLVRRVRPGTVAVDEDASTEQVARRLAEAIVAQPAYQAACEDLTCRRDVGLLGMVDGLLVDTTVDLVYDTADGAVLVQLDLDDDPDDAPGRADRLARAFLAATGQRPAAVELIHAAQGAVSRFTDGGAPIAISQRP